jgi:hypothetical protein
MQRWLSLFAVLIVFGVTSNCGGSYKSPVSGGGGTAATITDPISSVGAGSTYTFSASTPSTNGYTPGIMWSITGAGNLSTPMNNGFTSSVVYTAPASVPSPNSVTIMATPSDTMLTAATNTFSIGVAGAPTSPYIAMLAGRYAFEVSGFDANGEPSTIIGSIAADGSGKITAGSLDLNTGSAATARSSSLNGTYTLNSTLNGTITLSANISPAAQPLLFTVALTPGGKSGTLTAGDAAGFEMKGTLQQQDTSAFSLDKISGEFAFKLESNPAERVATVGRFAIAANANIAGLADSSKSGAGPLLTSAPVVGRVTSAPDASGRGTLSLVTGSENPQLVYYIVSSKALMMMETTSGTPGANRQVGLAQLQVLPFAPSTVNASSDFRAAGFDQIAAAPGPVAVTGKLSIANLSHATIDWDATGAGMPFSQTALRSELVAFDPATGRGTIAIANGNSNNFADSVVFYLADSGRGFLLDTTPGRFNRAIAGDLKPATGVASSESQ